MFRKRVGVGPDAAQRRCRHWGLGMFTALAPSSDVASTRPQLSARDPTERARENMAEPRAQQEQDLVDGTDEARMATPPTRMSAAMEVAAPGPQVE